MSTSCSFCLEIRIRTDVAFIWYFRSETKKDKLMIGVLRGTFLSEMKFFAFVSLTLNFNIKFQYIKRCIPSKIPRGGDWGMREALWMDKIMGLYIFPHLMFSILFVSVMHFHNHLCFSISPKILKKCLPDKWFKSAVGGVTVKYDMLQ